MRRTFTIVIVLCASGQYAMGDGIPSFFSRCPEWHVAVRMTGAYVPATNPFLKGENPMWTRVHGSLSGSINAGFSYNESTREGMLYKGVYQGVGVDMRSFFATSLLGNPVSVYVYQGAPIVHLSPRLWLGYEWQFGAAFGWRHYNAAVPDNKAVVSTAVTAHMGLGVRLYYDVTDRWRLSAGVDGTHFSNGNTRWPNAGVNSLGLSVGMVYVINPTNSVAEVPSDVVEEADKGRWMYDIMVYGAWRRRVVHLEELSEPQLCPGKFGVVGVQFAPMRRFNRWVSAGPSLDLQWDESAGLAPYWIKGTEWNMIRFERPPFGRQITVGVSAHAELTMPIFAVNVGIGWAVVCPQGDRRLYQSLTLKTFLCRNLYLNTGYSIGGFVNPRNLMLGVGVRL